MLALKIPSTIFMLLKLLTGLQNSWINFVFNFAECSYSLVDLLAVTVMPAIVHTMVLFHLAPVLGDGPCKPEQHLAPTSRNRSLREPATNVYSGRETKQCGRVVCRTNTATRSRHYALGLCDNVKERDVEGKPSNLGHFTALNTTFSVFRSSSPH